MDGSPLPRIVTELFGIPGQDVDEGLESAPRKAVGDTAEESSSLGGLSLLEGDYEAAIRHFKKSIEQRGEQDPTGQVELGAAYEVIDEAPQALRQYRKALRAQSQAEPLAGISQLLRREGRFRDAVEEQRRAIDLEPDNALHHFRLAELLREAGFPRRALEAIERAVVANPAEPFYHYWMGDLLLAMKRWSEAIEALHAAVELSPGDDHLFFRAASAFWGAGRQPEAVKAIRLAGDLDPDKPLYAGALAVLLFEMGQVDDANQELTRAKKMDQLDRENLRRFCAELGLEPLRGTL